jgi:hypothetical protein
MQKRGNEFVMLRPFKDTQISLGVGNLRKDKGEVSQDEFFYDLTNQVSIFVYALMVFKFFLRLKMEKSVLLACLLTNFENTLCNPLQRPHSRDLTIRILTGAVSDPENCFEAGYDRYTRENLPIAEKHRRKSTNGREERQRRKARKAGQEFCCGFRKHIYN